MIIYVGTRKLLAKTCKSCGLLKQARDFTRVAGNYRNSYCNKCKNLLGRPAIRRHQQRAQSGAVKHGQPWTEQDIELLLQMSEKGLNGPQIAIALNRTVYSVYTMKYKLYSVYTMKYKPREHP